jgi:hypothetical protein
LYRLLIFLCPAVIYAGSLNLGTGLTGDAVNGAIRSLVLPMAYKQMGDRLYGNDNGVGNTSAGGKNKFYAGVGLNGFSIGEVRSLVNNTSDISTDYVMPLALRFEKDFQKLTLGFNANMSGAYRYFYGLGFGAKYNVTDEEESGFILYLGGDFSYVRATYPVNTIVYGLTGMLNRHLFDGCMIYTGFSYRWVSAYVDANVMAGALSYAVSNGYSGFIMGTSFDLFGIEFMFDWRYMYNQVYSLTAGVEL